MQIKTTQLPEATTNSREHTGDVICEAHRKRCIEGKIRSKLVFALASFLAAGAILAIGLIQYDEYFAVINGRFDYVDESRAFCASIQLSNIDLISTPISGALIILYILLYKRRVFARSQSRYRNIGIPMIASCWTKSERLLTGFTYGLIAFNIFEIFKSAVGFGSAILNIFDVYDPTGILPLINVLIQVLLIGMRYYPILVAFRVNSFTTNFTSAVYMWIDFLINVFQYGKCEGIRAESEGADGAELGRRLWFFIAYKVLSAASLFIFSSFIVATLTYRTVLCMMDFCFMRRSAAAKNRLREQSSDTIFCSLCNINDDNEILYCKHDMQHVLDLFDKTDDKINEKAMITTTNGPSYYRQEEEFSQLRRNKAFKYILIRKKSPEKGIWTLFRRFLYDWDDNFRFTTRFTSTMAVGIIALYYFFLFFLYIVVLLVTAFESILGIFFYYLELGEIPINLYEIGCSLSPEFCTEAIKDLGTITIKLPTDNINFKFDLRESFLAVFLVPIFMSFLLSLLHVGLLIRETRDNIRALNKGKCDFVRNVSHIGKSNVAASSFHFGGYFVGYLIWGFFIDYIAGVLLAIVIVLLRIFVSFQLFLAIFLALIPAFTVLIFKQVVNFAASRFLFLNRESQLLALKNFRAFNIFLYFNFYLDCFMGLISAVIRLVQAVAISVFMMPRLSYSFLGRHWEQLDNAYDCYTGFLHMEAMHTNPIILTFCSILYYKDLGEHLRRFKIEKAYAERFIAENECIKMTTFTGHVEQKFYFEQKKIQKNGSPVASQAGVQRPKIYNKLIVNKWHVIVMLNRNKSLIRYRKNFVPSDEDIIKEKRARMSNFPVYLPNITQVVT